jgi:hypothetical protein
MTDPDRMVTVLPADNAATVELTEWLIMADLFDEDDPDSLAVMERFGDFADKLFARHRLASQPPAALPASPPDLAGVVEKLKGLLAKATPGPWRQMEQWIGASSGPPPIATSHQDYATAPGGTHHAEALANAALIVEAVNALPSLLPALEALAAREAAMREAIRAEVINTPETADFMAGVPLEAAHQRERWGSTHDAGKTAADWFWLVGFLAGKAMNAASAGQVDKAKHHTISTAAALANWHAALAGIDTSMRPGIEPPAALTPTGDDHA